MFAIIEEMRARLQEIDDRQARLEMTTQDTCNNVANLQKAVAETQELVVKCMVTQASFRTNQDRLSTHE